MKVKCKKSQCLPKPLKSCTSGLDLVTIGPLVQTGRRGSAMQISLDPSLQKTSMVYIFLDIEHWTQSLSQATQHTLCKSTWVCTLWDNFEEFPWIYEVPYGRPYEEEGCLFKLYFPWIHLKYKID